MPGDTTTPEPVSTLLPAKGNYYISVKAGWVDNPNFPRFWINRGEETVALCPTHEAAREVIAALAQPATPAADTGLREAIEAAFAEPIIPQAKRVNVWPDQYQSPAHWMLAVRKAALLTSLASATPSEGGGKIERGHVCEHGIRWPHACQPCDDVAWGQHKAPSTPVEGEGA